LAVSLFGGRSGCQWHSGRASGSSWKSLPGEHRGGDEGVPIQVRAPDSAQAQAFRAVAGAVAARISIQALRPLPLITIH